LKVTKFEFRLIKLVIKDIESKCINYNKTSDWTI